MPFALTRSSSFKKFIFEDRSKAELIPSPLLKVLPPGLPGLPGLSVEHLP